MGEISDSIVNGECCELCNSTFHHSHGYPVVCEDCWQELTSEEKKAHQRAWISTL